MKLKNIAGAFLALAGLAFGGVASAGDDSAIYSIHPLDAAGNILPPSVPFLQGGDTARFAVRLRAPGEDARPYRLKHVGLGSYAEDWVTRRPKIGIFVSGRFQTAALESWAPTFDNHFTDFIFSYTVQPGDFELPIRLADSTGRMITDSGESSSEYWLDFINDTVYAPAWTVDNSTEADAATAIATFQYATTLYHQPTDRSKDYRENYDFTQCGFNVKTVDFDDKDETATYWRTVHEGSTQTGGADPMLAVEGVPTNSTTLYVWSMDESAAKIVFDAAIAPKASVSTKAIHVTSPTATENREVAEIKVLAGEQIYPFAILGVARGREATFVMSATPDFNYDKSFTEPVRLTDYTTVRVSCTEPLPASVRIAPALTRVTATSTSHEEKVTELSVTFSEPFGEDVNVEIVTGFTDGTAPAAWTDYIRFSARADEDVTLQQNPSANAFVVIPAGERRPTRFADGTPIVDGKIYVYALRSDDWSNGAKGTLTFGVKTDNANASQPSTDGGIDGWMNPPQEKDPQSALTVVAQDPVILQPAEGDASSKTYQGSECTFKIAVSDNWADMTNAFKVSVWKNTEDAGDNWKELEDDYFADRKSGLLYTTNGVLPKVKYDNLGENKTSIKVKSVLSGNESEPRNIVVTVLVAKGYTVSTVDDVYEFDEGTATQVKIVFDDVVPDDCYAYLKGYSAADTNVLNCSWIAGPGGVGEPIRAGATELSGLALQIADGDSSKLGSTFKYEVVLLTSPTWDESKAYTKFKAKNILQFKTHNVVPTVRNVTPNGKVAKRVTEGKTISGAFPLSGTVTNTFTVAVEEPGDYDKTVGTEGKRFETTWVFYNEDDGDSDHYPLEAPADGIIYGNPDTNVCTVVFDEDEGWSAGHYRVEVWTKDKDMAQASEDTVFTFYLDVIDNPMVTVETPSDGYYEQTAYEYCGDALALMKLSLSLNECNFEMFAKLTIRPNSGSENPGCLELLTNATDVIGLEEGVYKVRIPKKATSVALTVNRMDGTRDSTLSGFAIDVELPEEWNNKSRVPNSGNLYPYEYYVADENIRPAKVRNDKPVVDPDIDLDPAPSTNVYQVAAGLWDQSIRILGLNDVTPDFERPVQGGVTVSFAGGGGKFETNCTSLAEALAVGQTGFTPNFSGKSGPQTVTLVIKDHDGGTTDTFKWYFEVEDAKGMSLVAHGPATGSGAALSKRYRTAAGLGEGRVWASSDSDIAVSSFESTVNCGKASTWKIYGYGYKVGDTDNGVNLNWPDGFGGYTAGYYTDRDTPISKAGSRLAKGGDPDAYYAYVAPKDDNGNPCDSFLYAWLQLVTNDKGSSGSQSTTTDSYLNNATAPEYAGTAASHVTDSGSPVTLPTEKAKDGTGYSQSFIEAIFSRELFASDNMGDINQDGIPDIYVDKYGMGVVDTTTGQVSGDDLTKLGGFNEDEDYLPAADTASYAALIPGLASSWVSSGKPFSARLEIRGYGDALNDAPANNALTRVSGVVPDRVYLDPATDGTSTLEPIEYLAWREWAAENGLDPDDKANWTRWSPERPSDPTKDDTDDDGYPDGYEYYFWYRAHVGYMDGAVHRRLTGRAYDPRNPGEGTFIDSATIESLMDPVIAAAGESAETRDTDNDGLPDKLEFELGTNPFDFDTDGDGLPDGWEIMIAGTDPLKAYTTPGICDAMRNFDGDAMAFTTAKLESGVLPKPFDIVAPTVFALVQAGGMSDGVQWYADAAGSATIAIEAGGSAVPCTSFTVNLGGQNRTFVTVKTVPVGGSLFVKDAAGKLTAAVDLTKDCTWEAIDLSDEAARKPIDDLGIEIPDGVDYVRLMPVNLMAGTPVSKVVSEIDVPGDPAADPPTEDTTRPATCMTLVLSAKVSGTQAAWTYGSVKVPTLTTGDTSANKGGFGMLALGKYLDAPAKTPLAALPKPDENLAYLHYLVYQQYGFDPRTAWNANTPLAARWGTTVGSGENKESKADTVSAKTGYAGQATRTRAYTAYDEFLVFSFFLNNGMTTLMYEELGDTAPDMAELWFANTTNPQGPNEPDIDTDGKDATDPAAGYWGRNSDSGADTDGDGVPDGWELYVMSGPKQMGKFVFPSPYDDAPYSDFSPFVPSAKSASATDNINLSDGAAGDGDSLTEFQEFEGTDTMAYYRSVAPANPTIVHDGTWTWFNKFFPTDPWNEDTDQDGVKDNDEKGAFSYGDVDTGKACVPGGGLNPCSVDTDQDGLPDGWEKQFAGTKESVYTGPECQYATGTDAEGNEKTSTKATLQGLTDGMDGTVKDAYNYVRVNRTTSSGEKTDSKSELVIVDGVNQVVDRDYDYDGLENWQEYLVGTMRCWRYDDPVSPWLPIPTEYYYDEYGVFDPLHDEGKYLKLLGIDTSAEDGGMGEFWYRTLFDKTSKAYNPHLVTDSGSASLYFSRVTNGFDPNFVDTGSYYVFYDRINGDKLADLWKPYYFGLAPLRYVSCSPKKADTDGDGMDDYYELFHGLNPLLGADGSRGPGGCDVVYDAWYAEPDGSPISALENLWTKNAKILLGRDPRTNDPKNNKFDFELFPWLNGLEGADADGDDIRNQDEAIMPMMAPQSTWHHTDPSALWFTDTSYTNSLVRRFYRLPATYTDIVLPGATFEFDGKTYSFSDADGYWVDDHGGKHLAPFTADYWSLTSGSSQNWMYSFEENEGYDTDHDGISDFEELQGKPAGTVSDPQDSDSPHNRQAMYFAGEANPSALQSMPFLAEGYPRYGWGYPDDMSFLQYTVECWVRPEEVDAAKDYTVLERAIWSSYSAAGDEELLRKNFQIAIRKGCWYTKFDANGTLEDSTVELQSVVAAKPNEWAHVATTYDGAILRLFVNGVEVIENGVSGRGLKPEYGASAVIVHPGEDTTRTNGLWVGRGDRYWWDREYPLHAFIIGASAKNQKDLGGPTKRSNSHLNVTNGRGWDFYKDFFKGYIDEVRVWDGARSSSDIKADMTKRYTAADAKANREDFYDQWSQGRYRYDKDGSGKDQSVIPELRYHWSFDSLPGAENPEMAAKSAHGYGYVDSTGATQAGSKAPLARPIGYEIGWWKTVLDGYMGTVYGNPAYVTWVPNTVTHLPRFDGSTLDSFYWAQDTEGNVKGSYPFAQTAEPVSRWVQYQRQGPFARTADGEYVDFRTTPRRFWQVNVSSSTNEVENSSILFEFAGRHLNQMGDDLLPLGGAFVKYVDAMWDEQGPSTASRITGTDDDNNGLADWWDDPENGYAVLQGYVAKGTVLTWMTLVDYHGRSMTAGDAYLLDLAKGVYVDKDGNVRTDTTYADKADEDHDGIPDWWELLTGIHNGDTKPTPPGHADGDPDNDGLSNYQEYLVSYGAAPYGFYDLDPTFARSGVKDQKVTDYFLPVTVEDPLKRIFKGEYLGAILTDHDFMEDWWENKYAKAYASANIYDPWDDTDGDGWSNFAECRAFMWGGAFTADLIDKFFDGDDSNHSMCYPQPAIGVKVTYDVDQINDLTGKGLIVRTMTTGKRVDATFRVDGSTAGAVPATHFIGGYYESVVLHGFLNPGCIVPVGVTLSKAKLSSEDSLRWNYFWYQDHGYRNAISYHDADWYGFGTFEEYRQQLLRYPHIELEEGMVTWEAIGVVFSDDEGHYGKIMDSVTQIGTIDFRTGEYELDMAKMKVAEDDAEKCVFRFAYQYRIGENWPQTLWLSEATTGRVKEGLNTIEAFIDLTPNGQYDIGEPYGVVKNVRVGWHKVPELTLELTDKSKTVPRTAIVAAEDETKESGDAQEAGDKSGATTAQSIRIVRESINGANDFGVMQLKERTVFAKEFVMDDRAYLTEADVMSANSPDLDWKYLQKDAAKYGVTSIDYVTYRIKDCTAQADGSISNATIGTFTRTFKASRPKAAIVAPKDSAPVYTAAPVFTFTADGDATAFEIQVKDENDAIVYDSGAKMLGGRSAVSVGNSAYAFTAPIYVDAPVIAKAGPVLADGKTYRWRVAAFNAKFNTADPSAFCEWMPFQVDVGNANRYPDHPTGYGKVGAVVRYFGPATNDLTNLIVVEAFGNADFTGQALSQTRVGSLEDLASPTASFATLSCTNALLKGLDAGEVYLRAYIDLNDNGKWDRFEPWGYANMVGEYGRDFTAAPIYNPKAVSVEVSAYAWTHPNFAAIFIEDTDWNKNEIPDCLELELFPETSDPDDPDDPTSGDWWNWAGADEDEADYAVAGDVMAYAEVDRVRVVVGLEGDDENFKDYLLAKGEKVPTVGDDVAGLELMSIYKYGNAVDGLQIYGQGTNVTLAATDLKVKLIEPVKVALVHAQVYDEFGYDMRTANPVAYAAGTAVNTKPFTAMDKKLLLRYFEAIGYTPATGSDKYLDEYLDELALTKPSEATKWWNAYSLKVGDPDQNRDGVADGWQLYVMFNGDQVAASTPWTSTAAARTVTPGNEGLTWVQEYDNGRYPTDPWQASTCKDTYTTPEGTFTISDKDAYAYHLKHFPGEEGDKYADFDNDGLCNYDEYDIQKNNNRTLDADEMCSYFGSVTVPDLIGQCVPDYFLKSTRSNPKASALAGKLVYDYLGFDYTGADFIESWWKNQYGLARNEFVADFDTDGDGWDNWSEARASTDPTSIAQLGVDNLSLKEYPTPMIDLTVICNESGNPLSKPVILQAWSAGQVGGIPDAMWRSSRSSKGGSGEEKDEDEWGYSYYYSQSQNESNTTDMAGISNGRYLGRWSGKEDQHIHLSPGNITPSRVQIQFKDIAYGIETRQDGYLMEKAVGTVDTAKWLTLVSDVARSDDSTMGDLYFSYQPAPQDTSMGWNSYTQTTQADLKRVWVGEINYVTGEMTVNFDKINERHYNVVDRWNVGVYYYTRAHIVNPATSYVQVLYAGSIPEQASPARFYLSSADEASEKSRGHVRQGLNTFIAFADMNENGEYDPGEPFGCVKDVKVGWDKVTDLNITLTTTTPVLPRFDPAALGAVSNETGDVTTEIAAGAPVITDVTPDSKVRIVRWTINGEDCIHRIVLSKTAGDLGVITEADVLSKFRCDLDWDFLLRDAAQLNIEAEDVTEAVYAVFVGDTAIEEENVNGWIVKKFAANRAKAGPLSPSASRDAIVKETRPEFAFTVPAGYPAYVFELSDADGNAVFTSTNLVGRRNAAGNEAYRPPVFFGWDDAEGVHNLLPNGTYTWRIAMLNAKFRTAGDWSDAASFTVELAKGRVHDTDKGILEVAVRYYGDAPVDADHPIVVQAFRTADFTGVPEGQAIVTNAAVISSYNDTNTVNAVIYGLPEGDYYVLAFGDITNDCRYSSWETWGYANRVGTGARDIYTPVAAHVGRNVTAKALVFVEDIDGNNNEIPDWMEGFPADDGRAGPNDGFDTDGDGLSDDDEEAYGTDPDDADSDGDGVPDGAEIWGGTDPLTPDADFALPGDLMAFEDIGDALLVRIGTSKENSAWYAVMDLANEGWKLRDSDIPLQTPATNIQSLVTTWKMGTYTGIGTNVTFTGDEKVLETRFSDIRLIHAQVYAKNGYETGCAAVCLNEGGDPRLVDGIAAAEHPHTKPFTALDKYLVCRYLEAIGVEGFNEKEMNAKGLWSQMMLKADEIDNDRDDIADGWELYTMFGSGTEMKISPWNTADGLALAPGAGSQLKLVEEFDGGYYPTDPWSNDTDRDSVIDLYAYQYHLKGNDAGKDFDLDEKGEWIGDGLSNYAEYLISEVFQYAKLDPDKVKTDGACVDYFRKMGDLYLGEIFTDHDQVDDVWEGAYAGFANRDLYDPDRDDDKDGWSNYAEFRAGTDPSEVTTLGVSGSDGKVYTKNEYPIPVIEAKVVYNGNNVNLGSIVFRAWNEAKDPGLTSAPDAIWTIGNGKAADKEADSTAPSSETGSTAESYEKYLGRRPSGVQRYALGGGSILRGSVSVRFLDQTYARTGIGTNVTKAATANWYVGVTDREGALIDLRSGNAVGTVDYGTGVLTLDCAKLTGSAIGLPNPSGETDATLIADPSKAGNTGASYYDTLSLDGSYLLLAWSAVNVGLSANGTYTLGDADGVGEAAKSHGHVCEGLTTFTCYADGNANGAYDPGEPFGVVRGVDVGWQGAKFEVELTETSPIFSRVNLYTEDDDRAVTFSEKISDESDYVGNKPRLAREGLNEHVRIVPYMVTGSNLEDSSEDARRGFRYLDRSPNPLVAPRVVAEFDISPDAKSVLTEADFLKGGAFDIDWKNCATEITGSGKVTDAVGSVTAIRYRIVFGENGPVGGSAAEGAGATIETYPYLIERRFDAVWAAPKCEGVIGGGDVDPAGVVYTAHPTFVWSMPNESAWAKRYGSSYTAFKLRIRNAGKEIVYESDVTRAPKQDERGYFVWTAPISVGDQTPQGRIFADNATYTWDVAMFNAKFQPTAKDVEWSSDGKFSTSVNVQQSQNDAGFSSIGVTVKYTGPEKTLYDRDARTWICEDLAKTKCKVRVQAFKTADFSGVPASETYVADRIALTDTTDVLTNAVLKGLAAGTYYIRAYIDSNGNFAKDDFESWGYAKEPVTVDPDVKRLPAVGLYIEDADTNGNWYPDAWEYQYVNRGKESWNAIKGSTAASPRPDGKIVLSKTIYDQMVGGMAGISTGLSGSKITIFQDSRYAELLLDPYVDEFDEIETTFDAIRKAVEKKVVDKTLKITAITLDTEKSQVILAMDAETDYANLVAGNFATRLYDLDAMGIDATCTVTVQVWKKSTLAQENWELADTVKDVKIGRGEVEVPVTVKDNGADIDPTSGFYMIKVVQ